MKNWKIEGKYAYLLMRSGARFLNIFFTRYFEQVIKNIPYERLRILTHKERKVLRAPKLALLKTTLEFKLMLLAKCGQPFCIIVADVDKPTSADALKRMVDILYKKTVIDKSQAVGELKQQGFFVIADRDVVKSANIISNIYNDPVLYGIVKTYSETNEKMYANYKLQAAMEREMSAIHDLDKLLVKIMQAMVTDGGRKMFERLFQLTGPQFIVLAVLSRNRALNLAMLETLTQITGLKKKIAPLLTRGLVQTSKTEYLITGYGEAMLGEARNYFLSQVY